MSHLVRSRPRRPAWLYPVGSTLRLRDGRLFEVATEQRRAWVDPSMGCGGGDWRVVTSPRFWRVLGLGAVSETAEGAPKPLTTVALADLYDVT